METMTPRRMGRIAILAALCIVLRIAFGAFPNIKPITAFYLVSLSYLPMSDAVLIMALSLIGSGLLFGFSIVILWQIVASLALMLLWRYILLPLLALQREGRFRLLLQSSLAGLLAFGYGFVVSIPISLQFSTPLVVFWLNGLSFDLLHGVSTGLFYPLIYQIIRRIAHEKITYQP